MGWEDVGRHANLICILLRKALCVKFPVAVSCIKRQAIDIRAIRSVHLR